MEKLKIENKSSQIIGQKNSKIDQQDNYNRRRFLATDSDSSCPDGEEYVAWQERSGADDYQYIFVDTYLRQEDRMQFFAGTYYLDISDNEYQCYLTKIDRGGNKIDGARLSSSFAYSEVSECLALTVTEQDLVVAVGYITYSSQTSALIIYTDDEFNSYGIKMWSQSSTYDGDTPYQVARDVATTNDGGIFISGVISNSWIKGDQDCFILRLNYTLDRIYAKSFGQSGYYYECDSIQVTRNYDYIYLGGSIYASGDSYASLFFAKLDSYSDTIIATKLTDDSSAETLEMRRIILEHKNSFSGTDDNNRLYFCAYTDYENGGMVFGYVTSSSLTSISVSFAFRYGSPETEEMGDCTLTTDNQYFIGLFNTKHNVDRSTSFDSTTPIDYDYVYPDTITAQVSDPWSCSCKSCSEGDAYSFMSYSDEIEVKDYCEEELYDQLTEYTEHYNDYMYSWRTCEFYVYNYNNVDCSISDIDFSSCTDTSGTSGSTYTKTWGYTCFGSSSCCYDNDYCDFSSGDCERTLECEWPMTDTSDGINVIKPWYTNFDDCRNDEFKQNVFENIYTDYKASSLEHIFLPFMFCGDDNFDSTRLEDDNYCSYDYYQFVYEQDCSDDSNSFWNWFIFRVDVDDFVDTEVDNIPEMAAYFGDAEGYTYGYTITVDEYGYIYISGITDSDAFGADDPEIVWLYAKTHWDMTYELRYTGSTSTTFSPHLTYLGKRFIQPRKFKNSHNPSDPSSSTTTYDFATVFYPDSSSETTITDLETFPINENIYSLWTDPSYSWTAFTLSKGSWGDSFTRMSAAYQMEIVNSSESYDNSYTAPNICQYYYTTSGTDQDKGNYVSKLYIYDGTSIFGLQIQNSTDISQQVYMTGSFTSGATEGIYYLWIRGTAVSYDQSIYSSTPSYACSYSDYYAFYDFDYYESLRRFQTSQRIRIVIDDVYQNPPSIKENIPDIQPIVGLRYQITDIDNYFNEPCSGCTVCDYYKAKRSLDDSTSPPTTMLPYWINFHEQNTSFTMYPPYTGSVQIEVHCCNSIDQCVINTFTIDPIDTTPEASSSQTTTYYMQYDAYSDVGEYFQFAQTTTLFYDNDKAQTTDSSKLTTYDDTDTYYHVDHTVWLTMTSTNTGFDSVYWIGMIFGQAYYISSSSLNVGTQTINYKYQDRFSLNSIPTESFSIIINRMPSPTTTGQIYSFESYDPQEVYQGTYFDDLIPEIKDSYDIYTVIDTSTWFEDDDGDTLTYECTYSDDTDRPKWIAYNLDNGQLTGYPEQSDSNELIQLKIMASDTKEGSYYYIKTILVNHNPDIIQRYTILTLGVGREFTFYFGDYFTADIEELNKYNIDLYSPRATLSGIPKGEGIINSIQIRGTDVHGKYATLYLTLKIKNFMPQQRKSVESYPDQYIKKSYFFIFALSNEVFYDSFEKTPLILFPSTRNDLALPTWLHFDPKTFVFYGIAPDYSLNLTIQIRATNRFSHDSQITMFHLITVDHQQTKSNIEYPDSVIYLGSWFEYTFSTTQVTTEDQLSKLSINVQGVSGKSLPSWLTFNDQNNTIYGIANTLGTYYIDVIYSETNGFKTYNNMRVRVVKNYESKKQLYTNYVITLSICSCLLIYFGYIIHMNYLIIEKNRIIFKQIDESRKRAQYRFKNYQDVQVEFTVPVPSSNIFKEEGSTVVEDPSKSFNFTFNFENEDMQSKELTLKGNKLFENSVIFKDIN